MLRAAPPPLCVEPNRGVDWKRGVGVVCVSCDDAGRFVRKRRGVGVFCYIIASA